MKNSCSFDPPSVKKAGNRLEPYSNSDPPTLFLAGLEYYIPFMADICSSSMGVSYLDHPIRTVVLYGLLAGTCDLC